MIRLSIIITAILATSAFAQDIRVIDGDTFELDGEVIRLWGIDAPELDQTCEGPNFGMTAGEWSRWALEETLARRRLEGCETIDVDGFGRSVARCTLADGTDVGGALVINGYAFDWPLYSGGAYAQVEETARTKAIGMWLAGGECMPPWEWRERD